MNNHRRSTDSKASEQIIDLDVKVARLEEKLMASDRALELARQSLSAWQASSNEWRQENIDQRQQYMTIDKANALISVESSLRGALDSRVRILEDREKLSVGQHSAFNLTWIVIVTIVTIAISIMAILLRTK